ncbi:hypothetical protein VF14_08175 [Nostoc linckia z18]|uniref:Uncharacterized protein n=3 Tax=Nostoc linckia TaxID=92942 RepID=A0A9Q6EMB1_NOSLI|nr:hypothetical protein [Nostoc linckia]PHK21865.1 hypothetical protein VF11_07475 [Nostoc linckia z14]PHK47171.1 hypothetical protein VF13_06550 [Nostoc linckia z16]PHJ63872.1 hypothetical protein VF02_13820 [Nostoc linckia z1]PHJ69442.1 hypothetical protein VF05_13455 [Nostoc linckia z3]PHJ74725.1 hypothetical protein VF03_12900 [Nostoc linckia z2]
MSGFGEKGKEKTFNLYPVGELVEPLTFSPFPNAELKMHKASSIAADVVSSHPESSEEFQQFFGVRSMTFNVIIFIYHHKAKKTGNFLRLVIIFW